MAEIELDGDDVVIRLSRLEKVAALHGDVRVPRASVTHVRVAERPRSELRGLRMPGTGWPKPLLALGTWRRRGAKPDFVVIHGRAPVVVVELDARSTKFDRLLLSVRDVDAVVRLLAPR